MTKHALVAAVSGALAQETIHAEIIGDDVAIACGITAKARAPVLELSRKLVAASYDPATWLEAYRGDMLCLRIKGIGRGALLTVDDGRDTRFARWKPFISPAVAAPCFATRAVKRQAR